MHEIYNSPTKYVFINLQCYMFKQQAVYRQAVVPRPSPDTERNLNDVQD
jgi:hypothetical protein